MNEPIGRKIGFKPSPIGETALVWEERRLEEVCTVFKSGFGITSENIEETGDYPVYGGNGLRGYTDTFTHDGNYFLIGRQGALCGNIVRVKGKVYISEHAIAVQTDAMNDLSFLAYKLDYQNLNKLSESSAQPGLSVEKLLRIKITLPLLSEQRAIASLLETWDKAIEKTTQLIAAKEQRKNWLMQQLLTGKKRVKGFKDDWKESHFDDCFDIIKSYSISRDGLSRDLNDSSIYCVHYGDIHALYDGDFLDFAKQTGIPQIIGAEQIINERDYLIDGDLILADASEDYEGVGETIEVTNLDNKIAVGGLHTIVIRAKQNRVTVGFRAYLFAGESVRNELRKKATGTSVYSVTKSTLQTLTFKLPSLPEQTAIANILQAADKEINLVKQKLEAYKEQKKGLMQVLLTGKVRLKTI